MLGMAWEELEPRILLSAVSLAGDTNHDGRVNAQDYMAMKQVYAEGSQPDLLALAGNFGSQLVEISEPGVLDQDRAYYLVTCDMTVIGTGFSVTADYATLDFDGHAVAAGPMATTAVSVVNSVGATVRNGLILGPWNYGVWVDDSPGASVGQNIFVDCRTAVYVQNSPASKVEGNLIRSAYGTGVDVQSSGSVVIASNEMGLIGVGVWARLSPGLVVASNTILGSEQGVGVPADALLTDNVIESRDYSLFHPSPDRNIAAGELFSFSLSPKFAFQIDDISVTPAEPMSYEVDGQTIRVAFMPSQAGIYTIRIGLVDGWGNTRVCDFGLGRQETVRLYMRARDDVFDYGWLLPDPPETMELRTCGRVVEFTPHGLLGVPAVTRIVGMAASFTYKGSGALGGLLFGSATKINPYMDQDPLVYRVELEPGGLYVRTTVSLDFEKDMFDWNDYGLTIELLGLGPSVKTTPAEPSYMDVTYVW